MATTLIVLDGIGVGPECDACLYGDAEANTFAALVRSVPGGMFPQLERLEKFEGHVPYLRCLGPGFRLRRKRPVSASARFTKESLPNGRPVRVWSRSSSIPSG